MAASQLLCSLGAGLLKAGSRAVVSAAVFSAATVALAWLCACDSPYPIAPTPCDDWCFATQRAQCEDDNPFDCVEACEREIRPGFAGCEAPWSALGACYRQAPADSFVCRRGVSQSGQVCGAEASELVRCVASSQPDCVTQCLRRAAECGTSPWFCAGSCRDVPGGCSEEATAMYQCYQSAPITCERNRSPSMMPIEDEQCLAPILSYLQCSGFPPGDAGAP